MTPVLNKKNRSVEKEGREISLTPKEYEILEFLTEHPNRIFPAEEIYREVWEQEPFKIRGMMAVHLHNLREKIENNPARPEYLRSFRGKGYVFVK